MKKKDFLQAVGMEVKISRIRAKLTVSQIAKLTGITPTTISSIESGKNATSIDYLHSIANAIGVPVKSFFNFAE